MTRQLIAGNWKMNGLRKDGTALARGLVEKLATDGGLDCDLLVCPPAHLLLAIGDILEGSGIALGAQDCHTEEAGAHTGDLSAAMLADAGCSHVIVGHSERRQNHGETDDLVKAKTTAALKAGLTPVVCVGETQAERDEGKTLEVIERQVRRSLPNKPGFVLAYEPVWAIGTGLTPTPADVAEVHTYLRELLIELFGPLEEGMRILYGGSVKPDNAGELLAVRNVNGALVGGASLKVEDFLGIALAGAKAGS